MATLIATVLDERLEMIRTMLQQGPEAIYQRQAQLVGLQNELAGARVALTNAKALYEQSLAAATLEAYASGGVDGKNQAQRDEQLTAALAGDARLHEAKAAVDGSEAEISAIEAEMRQVEAVLAFDNNQFRAARYMADIETARIRAMGE